jgi:hypothetical protein
METYRLKETYIHSKIGVCAMVNSAPTVFESNHPGNATLPPNVQTKCLLKLEVSNIKELRRKLLLLN